MYIALGIEYLNGEESYTTLNTWRSRSYNTLVSALRTEYGDFGCSVEKSMTEHWGEKTELSFKRNTEEEGYEYEDFVEVHIFEVPDDLVHIVAHWSVYGSINFNIHKSANEVEACALVSRLLERADKRIGFSYMDDDNGFAIGDDDTNYYIWKSIKVSDIKEIE